MTTDVPTGLVQPYLMYSGRCQEALEFYRDALGATIGMMMRFDEAPDPVPAGMLPPGFERKIMHSEFTIGRSTLLASDGMDEQGGFRNASLALSLPSEAEVDRAFNALAEGGEVKMPLARTFWSPRFGMVQDRFGMGWMVMVPGPQA